ncbi:MAG: hypothetical protein IH899_12200 [Planctomycetes bacterium]|nr:hypothetical protein [Planctomycetota bacterium]
MLITGNWQLRDDGIVRPIMRVHVSGRDGIRIADNFLIDTEADLTVFSAALTARLHFDSENVLPDSSLKGIGGLAKSVLIQTVIELLQEDGRPVRIQGEFAAFTDPAATDLSILGRDVLDHFDLILSHRRDEILLLTSKHQSQVIES